MQKSEIESEYLRDTSGILTVQYKIFEVPKLRYADVPSTSLHDIMELVQKMLMLWQLLLLNR
jgi:hypothetical protein